MQELGHSFTVKSNLPKVTECWGNLIKMKSANQENLPIEVRGERKQFRGKREVREREFAKYRPNVLKTNAQK